MIRYASKSLVNFLEKQKVIEEEKREIYIYGYEIMFSNILGLVITLTLGLLFGKFIYALLFYAVFVSLRQYTGGYHANTYLHCNLFFLLNIALGLSSTELTPYWHWYYSLLLFIFYFTVILRFAPLDNKNKRLSMGEKVKHKKTAIFLSVFWIGAASIASIFFVQIGIVVSVTMFLVALLLVIGVKVEKRRCKYETN